MKTYKYAEIKNKIEEGYEFSFKFMRLFKKVDGDGPACEKFCRFNWRELEEAFDDIDPDLKAYIEYKKLEARLDGVAKLASEVGEASADDLCQLYGSIGDTFDTSWEEERAKEILEKMRAVKDGAIRWEKFSGHGDSPIARLWFSIERLEREEALSK